MPQCPVCYNEYIIGETQRCSVCGWDLTPNPKNRYSKIPKVFQEKQKADLEWARNMWKRSPSHKPQVIASENSTESAILRLQTRVDELQAQIQQGREERSQFLHEMEWARHERAFLQSQLQWLLYRIDMLNPQQISQSQTQPQEWQSYNQNETYNYSEVGMDYSQLINLLATAQWRKADEETWLVMLKVAGREREGWIGPEDIQNFPSTDIGTIDWFWQEYSSGRFGISVQQRIWESVGSNYTDFCDRVGWRVKESWLYYDDLSFNLNAAEGHLPVINWRQRSCYGTGKYTAAESFYSLVSRFAERDIS